MRVEIDSKGKVTVFDNKGDIVKNWISGSVTFHMDQAVVVDLTFYNEVDGKPHTPRGNG